MSDQETENNSGRLLIVSNRLPVQVDRQGEDLSFQPSVGGLATSLNALRSKIEMLWLGWSGIEADSQAQQEEITRLLRQDFGCIPLFLPAEAFARYYDGASNGTFWPLFHYFTQYAHYDERDWQAYHDINQCFCDKILEIAQPGDRIWIHDYHLMLLPAMVRNALPEATIGYFLHIPFPSSEIFRMLPWREAILEGLLGADLIGFHSFSYARHFLSSILRLLGLEQEFGRVMVDNHRAYVDAFPLGVDVDRFASASEDPEVRTELSHLRDQTDGRRVILSVDRLDFTKGIVQRLLAFERFLEQKPEWLERVSLISLCVPSRTQVPEYADLKRQVDELVGRINGHFSQPGWTPIWYLYRSLPFKELVPLYLLADVALVTPLRDGMNLVAKEYLAARTDGSGVLVLSETAGAAEELGEALIVNPHDEQGLVQALEQALEMPLDEQKRRNHPMRARLRRYTTARWADDFLQQLEGTRQERALFRQRRLNHKLRSQLVKDFQSSVRRLLLLDYDGTLVSFTLRPEEARPDDELLNLLKALAEDPRNQVVVISGRDKETLGDWLGELQIDLVAEHGTYFRLVGETGWRAIEEGLDPAWKAQVRPVMEVYVDRTPGSHLEDKGGALAWHYRRSNPEMASIRSKELVENLEGFLANTSLQVMQGNKVIEVKHSNISKGKAALRWLNADPGHDFILAAGDDVTDEDLFAVLTNEAWSVKIGSPERSQARFYLYGPIEVRLLLHQMLQGGE